MSTEQAVGRLLKPVGVHAMHGDVNGWMVMRCSRGVSLSVFVVSGVMCTGGKIVEEAGQSGGCTTGAL